MKQTKQGWDIVPVFLKGFKRYFLLAIIFVIIIKGLNALTLRLLSSTVDIFLVNSTPSSTLP